MASWAFALTLPALFTLALIALLRRSRWAGRLTDHPNERSLHREPTPRLGGIAIIASALPLASLWTFDSLGLIWMLAVALGLISFVDDLRSLPIGLRLAGHFAAAALAVAGLANSSAQIPNLGWAGAIVAVLALAWITNLYNFMDGADGLAAGMSLFGFGALAIGAILAGFIPLAMAATALASANLGFLFFNFPPAKVFLGDAGSIPLGFLAGALGGYGALAGAWPAWFPLLVFSPFAADATVTVLKRLARGERIWKAHREHYYQRLVLLGWSPRRLACSAYVLMGACALSALAARGEGIEMQCGILAAWTVAYLVMFVAIDRRQSVKNASL